MSNINITFAGLSIFHLVDDAWKVVFICDETHPVTFKWKKNDDDWSEPISLAPKDKERRKLIMEMTNPKPLSKPPVYPPELFDMTADYAHKDGVIWKDSGNVELAFMSMPYSTLRNQYLTPNSYRIRRMEDPSSSARPIGQVTRILKANIEILQDGSFQLLMDDGKEATPVLKYEAETTYHLDFYNDCDRTSKVIDDFELYYELMVDAVDTTIKYIAGELTYRSFGSVFSINESNKEVMLMTPGESNCDPLGGNNIADFPKF